MKTITDDIDFLKFLGRQESQYLIKPSSLSDEVKSLATGNKTTQGLLLPWSKTHHEIALRPGEVSMWGGYNGHGKSAQLGMIAAWGLLESSWLIASMEMLPAKTMYRMIRQTSGTKNPSEGYIERFSNWTDGRLWIYDQTDTVESDRILGMIHYAAEELKIQHIVVDSLMKCGFRGKKDDISLAQVSFVDRLCWCAKTTKCHIHIVHHMRKGEGTMGEYQKPGKHDFRGAGELIDLVDNAFIIHRNKKKENSPEPDETDHDSTLECVKQRHGESEPFYKFWFHKDSMQYVPNPDYRAIPYPLHFSDEWRAA